MSNRNIVVIGGSAGAMPVLGEVLRALPTPLPAAFFIVLHLQAHTEARLADRIARFTGMPIVTPLLAEEPILEGHVYVARPDHHLIVKNGYVISRRGPRENLWRPAIDVLFRSAAVAYTNQVTGLLLSGELDDGTAGLQAIKACGGIAVIQDPADAAYPDMPTTACVNVDVDHVRPASAIADLIQQLVNEPAGPAVAVPEDLQQEVRIAQGNEDFADSPRERIAPSGLSCPECAGPLWRRGPDAAQFRCLVGHSYRLDSLLQGTDSELERTLWAAIRLFEQRANIARSMAAQEQKNGRDVRAKLYNKRAEESQHYATILKGLQSRGTEVASRTEEPGSSVVADARVTR